jgi:hypothetical protein
MELPEILPRSLLAEKLKASTEIRALASELKGATTTTTELIAGHKKGLADLADKLNDEKAVRRAALQHKLAQAKQQRDSDIGQLNAKFEALQGAARAHNKRVVNDVASIKDVRIYGYDGCPCCVSCCCGCRVVASVFELWRQTNVICSHANYTAAAIVAV